MAYLGYRQTDGNNDGSRKRATLSITHSTDLAKTTSCSTLQGSFPQYCPLFVSLRGLIGYKLRAAEEPHWSLTGGERQSFTRSMSHSQNQLVTTVWRESNRCTRSGSARILMLGDWIARTFNEITCRLRPWLHDIFSTKKTVIFCKCSGRDRETKTT